MDTIKNFMLLSLLIASRISLYYIFDIVSSTIKTVPLLTPIRDQRFMLKNKLFGLKVFRIKLFTLSNK